MAVIEVADTGIGIAPATLPLIFEALVQGPVSIDRAQGGLGLGLALVRELAAQHGGTVTAASAGQDQGSTFTLRLPLAPEPAPDPAPDAATNVARGAA
jgi:signal transduction histidine kinase